MAATYVRTKICGLTTLGDARSASECGADAIGLVFYPPSPRCVSLDMAREIAGAVGPFVTVTGLFVNPDVQQVEEVLKTVPLHLLQFHGDESPDFCERFQRPYIKAIRVRAQDLTEGREQILAEASRYRAAQGILLDTFSEKGQGGTGEVFNWQCVPENKDINWILAGGLNPGNVHRAVQSVQPYGVDVSSGVELSRGVKDPDKIRRFIEAVRAATQLNCGK